jgi:hypothetical protein
MEATNPERARNPILRALDTGRVEAIRDLLFARLQREGARVNPDLRRRVEACTDAPTLTRWVERLMSGASLDEALSA